MRDFSVVNIIIIMLGFFFDVGVLLLLSVFFLGVRVGLKYLGVNVGFKVLYNFNLLVSFVDVMVLL